MWENYPVRARVWFCVPNPVGPSTPLYIYFSWEEFDWATSTDQENHPADIRRLEARAQFLLGGRSTVQSMWVSGDRWVCVHTGRCLVVIGTCVPECAGNLQMVQCPLDRPLELQLHQTASQERFPRWA